MSFLPLILYFAIGLSFDIFISMLYYLSLLDFSFHADVCRHASAITPLRHGYAYMPLRRLP